MISRPNPEASLYNAEISAGSLMLRESRQIAKLLLEGADDEAWEKALYIDNVLQKKIRATARRMARLIRNRLEFMTPDLWKMVVDGSSEVAIQGLLAAAIKHSRLLGDFLNDVIKEYYKVFNQQLSIREWNNFLVACEHRDPAVATWSQSTRAKLGQVVFRILAEAKYLDSTRSMKLMPVVLTPEIQEYLKENQESYVLRCMDVSHE
jgi:hypothetical protein